MIKYGLDRIMVLKFVSFQPLIERRNEQFIRHSDIQSEIRKTSSPE
ncbi:hypothetical protein FHS15_001764 [Paenibacillus castaneae]|nr:hypothetical protein [Paenibacillus castaneae]NIK76639.1 hypothetical protein [Paenibacillus castaneae]